MPDLLPREICIQGYGKTLFKKHFLSFFTFLNYSGRKKLKEVFFIKQRIFSVHFWRKGVNWTVRETDMTHIDDL